MSSKPMMKAATFIEKGRIEIVDKPIPDVGPNDTLIRITTTTICGTDVHILKGGYPVAQGLTVGHEPVGAIEKLGSAVQGYQEGQRVIAGCEGADSSIEALGTQLTFEQALKVLKPGGTLSSLGVYSLCQCH